MYELGAQYQLTPAGQDKTLELRSVINEKRKHLHDFELVFAYVQKLMEINSQVTLLLDAEYSSTKMSQQMYSASTHLRQKLNAVKLAELDLAQAHQALIEKSRCKKEEAEEE